jgi:hypothetical protein
MRGFTVVLAALLAPGAAGHAIKDRDNQGRWAKPTVNNSPDKEVPGFLVNLGPTGARAILTERTFIVKHVFKGSPAEGRLRLDDVIVGAFGKPFAAHTFGGSPHGYEGPIMDLGLAVERAEGKDGKLPLDVVRGGAPVEVRIDLEPLGAFSPTFPDRCPKSERVRARALKYLAESPDATSVGQAHARSAVALALLAAEVPAQQAAGRRMALAWNQVPGPGTWTWDLSFQLITLSEYHLQTGDAAVLSTIRSLCALLRQAQYDGHILAWDPKEAGVDAAQQLYRGGFGHGPYQPGLNKNGYGPMQYTTIFAVIAWQLAERCGAKPDPRGVRLAYDFIHRGTNASGYVAYGGEFTLNSGLVDPVAWKKSRSGDNYVGRAGASLIAHRLGTEQPDAAEYADLNRGYLQKAYRSLPDGHADSNLGILWGLLGAAAAGDEATLRTTMDYHKAWFNMMRGHDGSFVLLPGRDYADDGYYMASRYHPTATLALVLGLASPKLLVQGVPVAIPGVNPKALTGAALAAYQQISAKSYGEAAKLLRTAGPGGAPLLAYVEAKAAAEAAKLEKLGAEGRWTELQLRLGELRRAYAGAPAFDAAATAWEAAFKSPPGAALLAAGRLAAEGKPGKALAALDPARAGELAAAAKALEARILAEAKATLESWVALEQAGAWHRLRKELEKHAARHQGIDFVDARIRDWEAALATPSGRALAEADRLVEEGSCGPALKALEGADPAAAGPVRSRAEAAAARTRASLEKLEQEGRFGSLREELAKSRPKMAGIAAFEERARGWDAELAGPEGRALAQAEKLAQQGDLGAAAKALAGAGPRSTAPMARIEEAAVQAMAPLKDLEAVGDWHGVERALAGLRKKLAGVPGFDAREAALEKALRSEPAKSAARWGAALARIREKAGPRPGAAQLKELESLAGQAGDSHPGREARALLKSLGR